MAPNVCHGIQLYFLHTFNSFHSIFFLVSLGFSAQFWTPQLFFSSLSKSQEWINHKKWRTGGRGRLQGNRWFSPHASMTIGTGQVWWKKKTKQNLDSKAKLESLTTEGSVLMRCSRSTSKHLMAKNLEYLGDEFFDLNHRRLCLKLGSLSNERPFKPSRT